MSLTGMIRSLTDPRMLVTVLAAIALWRYGSGCDETLPQRVEPAKVFTASARGMYIYRITANGAGVVLKIVNTYDETLQEKLSLDGSVDIQWNRSPDYWASIPIKNFTLTYSGVYDSQTGIVTLDPGDSLTFFYLWNFTTNNGVFIPGMFEYIIDETCPIGGDVLLKVSNRTEMFNISGRVKIMDKTGYTLINPSSFNICHYANFWVEAKYCPNNQAGWPCP
jgi:hypothetical protein